MSVYSYHTFVLPFIWERNNKSGNSMDDFVRCFEQNPNWIDITMKSEFQLSSSAKILSEEDARIFYKEYQYFHPFARKALYGYEDNIVRNFSFLPELVREKGRYIIKKTINGKEISYCLTINAIELKIFNTGVGLFILECENPAIGGEQNTLDAVKNINDYGRRICLPFIPNTPDYFSICADSLTLEIDGLFTSTSDMIAFAKSIRSLDDIEQNVSLTHMCDFIKEVLGFGSDHVFSSRRIDNSDTFYIYPALDDRMFVLCYINDAEASYALTKQNKDGLYAFEYEKEASESLYELCFVDPAHNCSCQDQTMRLEQLKQHCYRRWLGSHTLYMIDCQSLICLAGSDVSFLVEPVLTQYLQLCYLCLVQRASLINFHREASKLSANIEQKGKQIRTENVSHLMDLQERFIAFENQLHFTEVTPQQQGIEMYNMMMELFFIERELQAMQNQLENLYNAANTNIDFNFNKWAGIFAAISIVIAFFDYSMNYFAALQYKDLLHCQYWCHSHGIMILVVILSVLAALYMILKFRRRN